jgi:tetratricopeptide (TPR) repeat protein
MTIVDWILLGLLAVSAIALVVLVVRQWKKLTLIDLEAMPKEKIRSRKYQLIEERLERKTRGMREFSKRVLSPVSGTVAAGMHRSYQKLLQMERKYRLAVGQPKTEEERERRRQKVVALMQQGEQVFNDGNYGEAEQIFLDTIRLNPQEVEAYEYLGEVYAQKKEYDHAIETLEFARHLNPNEDRIYYDIGMVYSQQGNSAKALENLKECVRLSPNNPRNLDSLLAVSIAAGDRVVAVQTLRQLKEANPENQKIAEFEEQVKGL